MSENVFFFRASWASLRAYVRLAPALSLVTLLSSCGGDNGPSSYALNAYVSGLTGSGLQVTLNGGAPTPISANSQTTVAHLKNGTAYSVAINAQPISPAQTCTAANPSGKISGNNVDVMINCVLAGTPAALIIAPDQASGYSTVTLDGSSSTDSTSTISTFQWIQTSGAAVTLVNPSSANPSFIAPNVTAASDAVFQLTITDALGTQASSSATIHLIPATSASTTASFVSLRYLKADAHGVHTDTIGVDTPPMIGTNSMLEVNLGGAIAHVSFSLVDGPGNLLGSISLSLSGDSSLQPLTYTGTFSVPAVPYFVVAKGTTGDGVAFTVKSGITTPINMGLSFSRSEARLARGASINTNLVIYNAGAAASFAVTYSDPHQLVLQSPTTVDVPAGQSVSVPVTVTVPSNLTGSVAPELVASAAVSGDASRTASTTFTVWLDGAP